jgi:hypothetical protein
MIGILAKFLPIVCEVLLRLREVRLYRVIPQARNLLIEGMKQSDSLRPLVRQFQQVSRDAQKNVLRYADLGERRNNTKSGSQAQLANQQNHTCVIRCPKCGDGERGSIFPD